MGLVFGGAGGFGGKLVFSSSFPHSCTNTSFFLSFSFL